MIDNAIGKNEDNEMTDQDGVEAGRSCFQRSVHIRICNMHNICQLTESEARCEEGSVAK